MNCPVCERSLAPTLSICPTCGAMMNDTVREELQTKITSGPLPGAIPKPQTPIHRPEQPVRPHAAPSPMRQSVAPPPVPARAPFKTVTAGLVAPKTSPTLVDFQNKNAKLPDWRIQLQNAVQQRKGSPGSNSPVSTESPVFASNGSAAIKAEVIRKEVEPDLGLDMSDPIVAKAMQRIEESRKAFAEPTALPKKRAQARPFGVVAPTTGSAAAAAPARTNIPPKPVIVPQQPTVEEPLPVAEKRDTNKLPPIERVVPIPEAAAAEPVAKKEGSGPLSSGPPEIKRIQINLDRAEEAFPAVENYDDEIEDLAPFSMRFGAGLFDMIIAGFATMLLLSPLAFTNSNWFTAAGLLTCAGGLALVSFLYMTTCLGFFGKTMGMRLFSLELVDAIENEYPTLKQAAVNSSVFLLSLAFCGAGFLTAFFNEERRALHDLLSGTILVRDF